MTLTLAKKWKKAVATALIVSMLTPIGFFVSARRASAIGVPVIDVPAKPFQTLTSISTLFEKLKDIGLDGIAWMVAKMAIRQMTASLIDWINSGFDGNPAFVSNPSGFLLDVGDQVAGDFIFGSELGSLCDPLALGIDIRAALSLNFFGGSGSGYVRSKSCTLSQIIGNVQNAQLFVNGSFTVNGKGGWSNWLAVSQVPQNNIYGSYSAAQAELGMRVAGAKWNKGKIADWGQGFNSIINQATGAVELPGTLIRDQLATAFGSNYRALEAADELGEMVTAVSGALLNQAFTRGLGALSRGGNNSYTSDLRNGDPTSPFIRPSAAQQASWSNINNGVNTDVQSEFDSQLGQIGAHVQAEFGSDFTPVQRSKLDLTNEEVYRATQSCTRGGANFGDTGPASAIDQSDSTYSDNRCGPDPGWWNLSIAPAKAIPIDEIRIKQNPNIRLLGWSGNEPRLTLTDITGTTYSFDLPLATSDIQIVIPTNYTGPNGPVNLRTILIQNVKIEAFQGIRDGQLEGIVLNDFSIFRHLLPEVDARNVPSTVSSITASAGFDPRSPTWITAKQYPLYSDPQPLAATAVEVTVKKTVDGAPTIVPPEATTAPGMTLTYRLPTPGTYQIEYVAVAEGIRGAKVTRTVVVLPPSPPTGP